MVRQLNPDDRFFIPTAEELDNSVELNLNLDANGNDIEALVATFYSAYKASAKRTKLHERTYEKTLKLLLINLIELMKLGNQKFLAVKRGTNDYPKSRYNPQGITRTVLVNLLQWLIDDGYLRQVRGQQARGKNDGRISRVIPKQKLRIAIPAQLLTKIKATYHAKAEFIELKSPKSNGKKLIDYKDNSVTLDMRSRVSRYNTFIQQFDIRLNGLQLPSSYFYLTRIFNNGSPRNYQWNIGGRFYAPFQQLSKDLAKNAVDNRRRLTINGAKGTEYDFSRYHPTMLYLQVGQQAPGDHYTIPGYAQTFIPLVKTLFNSILNCSDRDQALGVAMANARGDYKHLGLKMKDVDQLLTDIQNYHAVIGNYFWSGYGVQLQFKDSVIAQKIIDEFLGMNKPILPVHDSFVVMASDGPTLEQTMRDKFKEVCGGNIKVDKVY